MSLVRQITYNSSNFRSSINLHAYSIHGLNCLSSVFSMTNINRTKNYIVSFSNGPTSVVTIRSRAKEKLPLLYESPPIIHIIRLE